MARIMVIASGGLDSYVLYRVLLWEGHTVEIINFDYGSKHNLREREALERLVPIQSIHYKGVDIPGSSSSLVNRIIDIPKGDYREASMKSTVVPFRNGVMLAHAASLALDLNFDGIAIGVHAGDHYIYPDCRPTFINLMAQAIAHGTEGKIATYTPFIEITKGAIVHVAIKVGVTPEELSQTYSCYEGRPHHCGLCGTCTERKEAFKLAGVEDLTVYETTAV